MNHLIIWSKDRAAQLDMLLNSVASQRIKIFDRISVIFKASSPEFLRGYLLLDYPGLNVRFYNEQYCDFERLTKTVVNNPKYDSIYFCTDDTVLYAETPNYLPSVKYGECISLRLGLNTIMQNCHTGEIQLPLNQYVEDGNWIRWNPHSYYAVSNYGYCFGLDMCGYNATHIRNIFKQISFKTTNQLESALFKFRDSITTINAFSKSVAVNIPYNNISGVTACMQGTPSLLQLNTEFLNGKRLKWDTNSRVIGCHQEIPLWME